MGQIRDSILKQMLRSELTIYQVSKMVEDKVPRRTVYAFLTGEKDTGTEAASIIMRALGLTVKSDAIALIKGIKMKAKRPNSFRGRVIDEWKKAGNPSWGPRELLGMCLLVDFEFKAEGCNPAKKFRKAIESKDYGYLINWAQGLHIPWK
jgi:hypothetical protein